MEALIDQLDRIIWTLAMVIIVSIPVVGVAVALIVRSKVNRSWTEVARKMGLRHTRSRLYGYREMGGAVRGFKIRLLALDGSPLDQYWRHEQSRTKIRVRFPKRLGLGLRIRHVEPFDGVKALFGMKEQDIEVGTKAFDDPYVIQGSDPEEVRAFLSPRRILRINRLFSRYPSAEITDREIRWETGGIPKHPEDLVGAIRAFLRTAQSLAEDEAAGQTLDVALMKQAEGRLDEALDLLRPRPAEEVRPAAASAASGGRDEAPLHRDAPAAGSSPDGLAAGASGTVSSRDGGHRLLDEKPGDDLLVEGELLYMAGRRDEAREVFERALAGDPSDAEVRGWLSHIESEPGTREHSPNDESLDAASVCEALFSEGSTSIDAIRYFEEKLEGRVVRWEGVLERLESFAYDFVLGGEPGTRATVAVRKIRSMTGFEQAVCAIAGLPADSRDALAHLRGRRVVLRGRLIKVDALMHNLYLDDATIEE